MHTNRKRRKHSMEKRSFSIRKTAVTEATGQRTKTGIRKNHDEAIESVYRYISNIDKAERHTE